MLDGRVADRRGQDLETLFARKTDGGWSKPPFLEYPFASHGMMFPRSVTVPRAGLAGPETRFRFPVDEALLALARSASADVALERRSPPALRRHLLARLRVPHPHRMMRVANRTGRLRT